MQTRDLIGGAWVVADDGRELEVTDPATSERIAVVPCCGVAETRRAIDAAASALPDWRARTAAERAAPLHRMSALMHQRRDALAELMTREQGKPLPEALGEIAYAASFLDWAAEEGKRVLGEVIPASHAGKRILVLREPVGVTAAITPWNFPAAMITRKLGPALAAGCTMVVKPAESTPLSALALGEIALEAGVPAGVVNIVTGDPGPIGDTLLGDARVRKLSFTGSTEVGRLLMRKASAHLTRLSLELGGHAPFLVFDDADVEAAVAGAMASKFRNTGQTCVCANRFYVQDGVYDEFVARLQAAVEALRLGHGLDEGVQLGPLIDEEAVQKVQEHVHDALDKGARLRTGGRRLRPRAGLNDRFYAPTILEDFGDDMRIAREETFGPVSPIRRFTHEDEAIAAANDSEFGLAAYFFTRDASRLMRVAERLEYGIVGANDGAPSTAQAPFGGVKHSGFGREGGHHVMHEYLSVKYVSWGV
ncbi:MAG: NAD-dependent succinate-semialdehyde dehydrogenase [Myxococcales bacterium]|nr:NAD-dependent succinate-semialdehyde dehydrogenase [Myxococcales bacterium]